MNGYEHYERAEQLMAEATRTTYSKISGANMCWVSDEEAARLSAQAQVHATLALAAATADASNFKRDLYAGNGEELPSVTTAKTRADRAAASAAAFLD